MISVQLGGSMLTSSLVLYLNYSNRADKVQQC